MNNTTLTGRLTRDPEVRHNTGANGNLSVAKYTLAVRRPRAKQGEPTADFIRCTAFGPKAAFAENYLATGMTIEVSGTTLQRLNRLARLLEQQPIVDSCAITTANKKIPENTGEPVQAQLIIYLRKPPETPAEEVTSP